MVKSTTFQFPNYTRNNDGTYGPTSNNHFYIPVHYHNRTAKKRKDKNRWYIKENCQYEVFRIADEPYWFCNSNNCLFSIVDEGRIVLGKNGERLAKFPLPSNLTDPWHGWPVSTAEEKPSEDLLDSWEKDGVITDHLRRKIGRGAL